MILLTKLAFQHRRRLLLLLATFLFMLGMTASSQLEMISIGVITKGASGSAPSASPYNPLNVIVGWIGGGGTFLENLPLLALFLLIVAVFKGLSHFGAHYTKQLVMVKVSRDIRERYFIHIQSLSLDFYQRYSSGALTSRIMHDSMQVAQGIAAAIVTYIQTPIAVITSLVLCLLVSLKLSLIMFLGFPLLVGPVLYFARKLKRVARKTLATQETFFSAVIDFLSGIQTVKLFGLEKFSHQKFHQQNRQLAHLEERSARYGFLARPVLHMASTGMLSGLILYGLYVAHLGVSDILVFCGLVYVMYEPIKRLNDENIRIQQGVAAAERIWEVMCVKPDIADHQNARPLRGFSRALTFDNVSFSYGDLPVLHNLSFTINKGQTVALVGATGAGKSTIAHLIPRLYEPTSGTITLDGKPLTEYTLASLKETIAFVPQKPFLFLDTVAENIAFGRPYTREQVIHAAKRAHAHEFIERLPHGYDTLLKEAGKNLSGGQQQRLAIARALIKEAPILVLDEATSSLDVISEERIKEAIHELKGEITQVIIAHRLSTIEDADQILFLEQGRLLASGTREELLNTCPPFAEMWQVAGNR
ncbi:MAG: ABC transporter ATP-binding protein [Parachlamydiales bacterium]